MNGTCDQDPSTVQYALNMLTDPLLWAIALMGAWGALTLFVLLTMVRDRHRD